MGSKKLFIIFLVLILIFIFKIDTVRADLQAQEGATISATVVGPSPTPTPTAAPAGTATPTPSASPSATPTATPKPTIITAKFIIYGYGPTDSTVYLTAIGVSEETSSDSTGYFEFTNLTFPTLLSPAQGNFYPELCLYAMDDAGRLTSANCIPPMPFNISVEKVGPILLSPTFAINKGSLFKGDESIASGKTTPNTQVEIQLSRENKKFITNIIPEVSAYTLPIYQIESDENGYFEFSLPTNTEDNWKMFSSSAFLGSKSPISNILSFSVNPAIYKIVNYYKQLTYYIKPSLFNIILILEIFTIFFLIFFVLYLNRKYEQYDHLYPRRGIKKLQSKYERIQEEYLELLRHRRDLIK